MRTRSGENVFAVEIGIVRLKTPINEIVQTRRQALFF